MGRLTDHFEQVSVPWHEQKNKAIDRIVIESTNPIQTQQILDEECPNLVARRIAEDYIMRLKLLYKKDRKKYQQIVNEIRERYVL